MRPGRILASLVLAALASLPACDKHGALDDNFHETGFIGEDRFQVVIRIAPSESARGLVGRRESAMKEGRSVLAGRAAAEMWGCCLKDIRVRSGKDIPDDAEKKQRFSEKAVKYSRKGTASLEYFDEDDAVTIVYRVDRKNIKRTIISLAEDILGETIKGKNK